LLAHVAGLSDAEVAEILEIEPAFVRRLLATAESAVHDQMRTSVLIIEDESLVACDLSDIVREMDHEVVGIARTAAEAVEIAGRERPGLILADIRLADGSTSFEGLDQIARYGDIPTIFITAYPGEAVAVGHAAQGGSGQGGSGQGVSGQGGRGQGGRGPTGGLVLAKPFSTSAVKHSIAHTLFHSQLAS
jgi:CheY-like chemotaxis protein